MTAIGPQAWSYCGVLGGWGGGMSEVPLYTLDYSNPNTYVDEKIRECNNADGGALV